MRLHWLATLIVALTGLVVASCGDQSDNSGADSNVIKIAVAGPLTGPNASFGAQLKKGVEQAVEDINAAGGMNGKTIELLYGDDVSDPKQGVSVANKFVGEGVKIVIGHFNSGVSLPASDVYAENGILMISPASTTPKFTDRGLWNVFRTCGRDDQQGIVAGKYIADNFKDSRVAVIHDKTTYGKGLADETKKAMNEFGVTEVIYEGVNTGEKDFSALISKLKKDNVDLIYWGGLHTEGGLIVRQLADAGLTAKFMGADGIATDEFANVGGPGAEGVLMTFPPDPQKRPEAQTVIEKFEKKGYKPEAYTLYSYAAVQVVVEAAKAIKSIDPRKIAAEIRAGNTYNTVIGDLGYNDKGDITRLDYTIYTWTKTENGNITFVEN